MKDPNLLVLKRFAEHLLKTQGVGYKDSTSQSNPYVKGLHRGSLIILHELLARVKHGLKYGKAY
jgi:hypothetical protein